MCCGVSTILSGHRVGVGRHIVLSRRICFVRATGLGQLPSCIVQCLMCVKGVTTLVFVEGVTTLWDRVRLLSIPIMSSEMRAADAADLSQLLSWHMHCLMCWDCSTSLSGHRDVVVKPIVVNE